jgi:hypothetical protein
MDFNTPDSKAFAGLDFLASIVLQTLYLKEPSTGLPGPESCLFFVCFLKNKCYQLKVD